ncbi:MAG: c-type cytochrome [Thermoanaerobaculales bacterium]
MPRPLVYAAVILLALALVPFALIARSRATTSSQPRIQIIRDMARQPKFKTQAANPLFADGRAMRPAVAGTVARGELHEDAAFWAGRDAGGWVTAFPLQVTAELMRRGQERYDIYCSPCHGLSGYGDGPVAKRADALQEGTWTPPSSYHTDLVRSRPAGHLFNTITNGIRNMPAYGAQIPVADRWAIVAYVRALELSQNATIADVPPALQRQVR